MTDYRNPRLDNGLERGDASSGEVSLDWAKVLWLSPFFLLGTVGSFLTVSIDAVVLFFFFTGLSLCFGHSLGMHRLLIHRSYQAPKWLEYFLVHLGVLVGLAGPFSMMRTHDTRDWAQRQTDCHDFFTHRRVWHQDMYWQLFCSIQLQNPPAFQLEDQVASDKFYQWLEKTWMWQQLPYVLIFFWMGGWSWVFWGVCSRVTVSVLGHWLIGYFAHNRGHRDWHVDKAAVQGHNVGWTALLTMGESWHNNHHAFPESAKLGLMPGQWDPGWWMLRLMSRLKLASNIVTPEQLPARRGLFYIGDNQSLMPGLSATD